MSSGRQHIAKVNVPAETWREFRVRALRANTTIADLLGRLVAAEVRGAAGDLTLAEPALRVDPWGRDLAGPGREHLYLTAEETQSGVDLTQLRRNLRLSAAQRLARAADLHAAETRLRGKAWPTRTT